MAGQLPPAEAILALVREQRRTCLKVRTIAVTLRSALDDFNAIRDSEIGSDIRLAQRRRWCEHAALLLQDLRAESQRTWHLGRDIGASLHEPETHAPPGERSLDELLAASEEVDREIDRGEELIRVDMSLAS